MMTCTACGCGAGFLLQMLQMFIIYKHIKEKH